MYLKLLDWEKGERQNSSKEKQKEKERTKVRERWENKSGVVFIN
jgi:hypothetical protein